MDGGRAFPDPLTRRGTDGPDGGVEDRGRHARAAQGTRIPLDPPSGPFSREHKNQKDTLV